MRFEGNTITIVIPCYKVDSHIESVVNGIPSWIDKIILVNDFSPDMTKQTIMQLANKDERIICIHHDSNIGVGGAMITGYKKAIDVGSTIIIKMDGDGQMNPDYLSSLILPLVNNDADFTKGNRFRDLATINKMPIIRRIGNLGLSFMIKAASGYWNIFDPTNGYTAIKTETLRKINFNNLAKRYYFESSMLIELYYSNALILDIPMGAKYGDEISGLSTIKTFFEFPPKLIYALNRRLLLKYFLYDFNIASLYLLVGTPLLIFGSFYGLRYFIYYAKNHLAAPTGTVVIPTLLIILGFQLILSAISYDLTNYPKK